MLTWFEMLQNKADCVINLIDVRLLTSERVPAAVNPYIIRLDELPMKSVFIDSFERVSQAIIVWAD